MERCSGDSNVLLKNDRAPCSSEALDAIWIPNSSPSFHGSASMVNFEHTRGENFRDSSFFSQIDTKLDNCNEDIEGCFHQPEKKRRLLPDQVQFLEKSFEVENKLEPERKVHLAKELGLQPRQVAIWFQNRRARYKTKLLEREYDTLKASYDRLKADYDALYKENEKTKVEVNLLTEKLLMREKGEVKLKPEPSDPTSPLDLQPRNQIFSQDTDSMALKQEEAACSAKSDVVDSDSPHYGDSSHGSDYQDDDRLSRRLIMPPLCFPKLEDEYFDDLQPNSCNLGFPTQEQGTWFWQY